MKTLVIAFSLVVSASALPAWSQTTSATSSAPPKAPAAQPPAPQPPAYGAPIGLEAAQTLINRAVASASARGLRLAVAIVEPSGELVAFGRMDDTQYGSIHVAQRKAATAARYRQATAVM